MSNLVRAGLAKLRQLAESSGALLIGCIQAGPGAVARWVLDKLRETPSVEDFGAVPDSEAAAATNAAAFQAALTAATTRTKRVICGTGKTYWLPTQTQIGAPGVTLDCRGATLKQAGGTHTANWLLASECAGFRMVNFKLDGNKANTPNLHPDAALLTIYNTEDVELDSFTVTASKGKGVAVSSGVSGAGTKKINISRGRSSNCDAQCFVVDRSNGVGDAGPVCEDVLLDRLMIGDTGHAGVAINDGSRRVKLTNSIIDVNNAVWDAVSVRGAKHVTIANNTGRRGRNGVQVSVLDAAALARGEDARDVILTGNNWEENKQNGALIAGAIGVTVNGDIAKNNDQSGVGGMGFSVTQVAGVRRASRVTMSSVLAFDDQTVPTQEHGINIAAADGVRVSAPVIWGNVSSNRVRMLAGVTDVQVTGDGSDGATHKRVSASTGVVPASGTVTVTINFTTAFDLTPTWAQASVLFGSATPYLRVQKIQALTTGAIQVQIRNDTAIEATGTIYAEAAIL